MNKGAEITMSTSSRGTLFGDHLVLQQGKSELAASSGFQLQANGIRVKANEPNSRVVVSMKPGNTVEVASLNGSFGVTNEHGVLLANVHPGRVVSFAMQAGANPANFSGVGLVSYENGVYYLTTSEDVKYVLSCMDFNKFVGAKVEVSGTLAGAAGTSLCVKTMGINGGSAGLGAGAGAGHVNGLLIAGIVVAGFYFFILFPVPHQPPYGSGDWPSREQLNRTTLASGLTSAKVVPGFKPRFPGPTLRKSWKQE